MQSIINYIAIYRACLLYLMGILSVSCVNELSEYGVELEPTPLRLVVNSQPISKALIEGSYLPDQSELGVFLRSSDGGSYDGLSLGDVKYIASGGDEGQVWQGADNRFIGLTQTVGKAYAYYPWVEGELSDLRVPITNDGTDWLYASEPATNLSATNPVAQFEMVHAMSIIRCRIVKGDYIAAGQVTTVGCMGAGLASAGVIDLSLGKLTDFEGDGAEIVQKNLGAIGTEGCLAELWTVPTGVTGTIAFRVVVDGTAYRVVSEELSVSPGMIYNFSMTLSNERLELSSVSYEEWGSSPDLGLDPGLADLWSEARKVDGVYAIDRQGNPVPYSEVVGDNYQGVAFVVKGKAYQVAHQDALGPDGTTGVYWCMENYVDIPALKNYGAIFNSIGGSAIYVSMLPMNVQEWNAGAVSDFDGDWNTARIIEAQTVNEVVVDNTIAKALVDFRSNLERNQGHHDWHIPSVGELEVMSKYCDQINPLLELLGGSQFEGGFYLSSSERNYESAYGCMLRDGYLTSVYKYHLLKCRFIRLL